MKILHPGRPQWQHWWLKAEMTCYECGCQILLDDPKDIENATVRTHSNKSLSFTCPRCKVGLTIHRKDFDTQKKRDEDEI